MIASKGTTQMQEYLNLRGNSGVVSYEIGAESITVEFRDGRRYVYNYRSAGRSNVEEMKRLAIRGYGLNEFINRFAKHMYVM